MRLCGSSSITLAELASTWGVTLARTRTKEADISQAVDRAKEIGNELTQERGAKMFGRHTVASTAVFAFDLALLWGLVALLDLDYIVAAVVAYLAAIMLFYVIARKWVFPDSDQGLGKGFAYFLLNFGVGFLVMIAVYWSLIEFVELHYLIARVAGSAVSGVVIFLLNAIFNFKEL